VRLLSLLSLLLTFASFTVAQSVRDPARLEVTVSGDSLSYKIINQSPYPIVGYMVYTQFTSGGFEGLGCGVGAKVKSAKDLSVTFVCPLPKDAKTGKPVSYVSRIVRVEFDNGLTWTPPTPPGAGPVFYP
jgi:hypothetical protein